MSELILKGIPAAPGVTFGPVFILDEQDFIVSPRAIYPHEVVVEIARFEEAMERTREELQVLKENVSEYLDDTSAKIFDAHLLLLNDETLVNEVIRAIQETNTGAEYVFSNVLKKYVEAFSKIKDEYLKERTSDITDIGRRVLKHLTDETKLHDLDVLSDDIIIVAHDISPSDAVSMYNKKLLAFVTDVGGQTSHTAIIAKSLGVPAVVGLKDATLNIVNQDEVIVDGRKGLVIVNPTDETKERYQQEMKKINAAKSQFDEVKSLPAETRDGKKVSLLANIELADEIPSLKEQGAEGIGLYRTEFLYMNRLDLPTEDEQFEVYKKVAELAAPYPVTIRTLDLGGDKFLSSIQIPKDMIGFLGLRAIRFCLECPHIFIAQLRAILRASAFGNVRIMYPMIASLNELRAANALLDECKRDLQEKGVDFNPNLQVGVMIEVPSAVMIADALAKESDFFSIGTNDLIQYSLAVDRVNEKAAYLYEPEHPAIIRLIKLTVDAAHNEGIKVSLCGEICSEPNFALLLLGLGLDEFSMTSGSLLQIKTMIRSVNFSDARRLAEDVLELNTGSLVKALLLEKSRLLAPNVFNANE